jgi:hypothetical protein
LCSLGGFSEQKFAICKKHARWVCDRGGGDRRRPPLERIAALSAMFVWLESVSVMTISPDSSVGHNDCATQALNVVELIG